MFEQVPYLKIVLSVKRSLVVFLTSMLKEWNMWLGSWGRCRQFPDQSSARNQSASQSTERLCLSSSSFSGESAVLHHSDIAEEVLYNTQLPGLKPDEDEALDCTHSWRKVKGLSTESKFYGSSQIWGISVADFLPRATCRRGTLEKINGLSCFIAVENMTRISFIVRVM